MTGHPAQRSAAVSSVRHRTYNLVQSFGGAQASWASANDQNIHKTMRIVSRRGALDSGPYMSGMISEQLQTEKATDTKRGNANTGCLREWKRVQLRRRKWRSPKKSGKLVGVGDAAKSLRRKVQAVLAGVLAEQRSYRDDSNVNG